MCAQCMPSLRRQCDVLFMPALISSPHAPVSTLTCLPQSYPQSPSPSRLTILLVSPSSSPLHRPRTRPSVAAVRVVLVRSLQRELLTGAAPYHRGFGAERRQGREGVHTSTFWHPVPTLVSPTFPIPLLTGRRGRPVHDGNGALTARSDACGSRMQRALYMSALRSFLPRSSLFPCPSLPRFPTPFPISPFVPFTSPAAAPECPNRARSL
ncbi:hypothetical protein C8R46DRAFT_345177 [Mycena filopes]|nr:hypothetical protein C8R46DRAFT_345177 [Mycena filopes]